MYQLIHGNCIHLLREMPEWSIDCIVTDMPAGQRRNLPGAGARGARIRITAIGAGATNELRG